MIHAHNGFIKYLVILHWNLVIDAISLAFCLYTSVNCQTPKVLPDLSEKS